MYPLLLQLYVILARLCKGQKILAAHGFVGEGIDLC